MVFKLKKKNVIFFFFYLSFTVYHVSLKKNLGSFVWLSSTSLIFFFLVFFTNPVASTIPLLMLHCLRPPSTILHRSSPLRNRLSFRSSFKSSSRMLIWFRSVTRYPTVLLNSSTTHRRLVLFTFLA